LFCRRNNDAQLKGIGGGQCVKARNAWVFTTKEKAEKAQKIVDEYSAQKGARTAVK
jgi:hypothetical protein